PRGHPPSGPELAAAVSEAGGLGVLGGAFVPPDELAQQIERVRQLTSKPFGVDTLIPFSVTRGELDQPIALDPTPPAEHLAFIERFAQKQGLGDLPEAEVPVFDPAFIRGQLDVVLDLDVPVYVAGLGDPGYLVRHRGDRRMKIGCVVGATRHAQKAVAAGADFVVAQGHDGGGHNSAVGTMALVPGVVDTLAGQVPVLAAGSIMDGRHVVASLALGAQGVWCGSAFLATDEAAITPGQKQAIVDHGETDTQVTPVWTGKPARLIQSVWTREFEASGLPALPMHQQLTLVDRVMRAADGRVDINPGAAGQGIGLVREVRPASQVFEDLVRGTRRVLERDLSSVTI
ncbi:MAG: nitronate monooxygenase, partial [Acidobacteriota bacterium]